MQDRLDQEHQPKTRGRKLRKGYLDSSSRILGKSNSKDPRRNRTRGKTKRTRNKKITPNLGTKSEEETQKKTETVTWENQLKKEQHFDTKSEEETQKKTHTITGKNQLKKEQDLETKSEEDTQKKTRTVTEKNQLKKEQDSDKTILHKDNNFGTTLVPNQPDGILKQVQKTQVKTQHNRKRQSQTQQNNLKKPRLVIKSQLEEIKQVREKYKETKDQSDKVTLSALVQSISD